MNPNVVLVAVVVSVGWTVPSVGGQMLHFAAITFFFHSIFTSVRS